MGSPSRSFTIGFAISFVFLLAFSSFVLCSTAIPVTQEEAQRAASTYKSIGSAQYPEWTDASLVLTRTFYDLAFEASAFEFAVQSGGRQIGHIIIGGNRDFPPLIEYTNGPSVIDQGVSRGNAPAEALQSVESGGEWTPIYVGGFDYYLVGPDAVSDLVDVLRGGRVELADLQLFSEDLSAKLRAVPGTFSGMWEAALSGKSVKAEDDYSILIEAEGYTWYRGCGPTSGTMVLGYYGNAGYRELDYTPESFVWDGPYTMNPYIPRDLADMVADICDVPRSGGRVDDYGVYTGELAGAIVRVAQSHGYKGFQCYMYQDLRDYTIYKDTIDGGDPCVFGITKMDPGSYDNHAIMGAGYNYRNPEAGHLAIVFDTWVTGERTAAQEYFITYRLLTVYSPLVAEQDLELSAESYDYGYVNVGDHDDWMLKIGNIGALPLLVNNLSFDDPDYSVTLPSFPYTIAAGESIFANIRFEPSHAGRISATMTIETDDPDPNEEFCEVSLSGRGIDNTAPIVRRAGFMGDHLAAGASGNISVHAEVYDAEGNSDIDVVNLFIGTLEGGHISSLELFDDGQHADGGAADGIYGNEFWVDAAPAGVYVFEIVAEDTHGASSNVWPYMRIGDSGTAKSNDTLWGVYPGMGEAGDSSVANIYMAGFDTTSITLEAGGKLLCVADIDDYLDGSSLARAELRFEGGGVLTLLDDGQGDDEIAGDERFTGSMDLTPGYPAGDYLLEIVAIDGSGRESVAYPFYVVR
ncbi:MAG: choice-of-anchor D domain-containing protein [Candidatus Coatesbacteria bacterium]|nr:choice-of-anchor D domain-containing protein [Candidatus Coatesbacteria bacterium]